MRGYIDTLTTISLKYADPVEGPAYLRSDVELLPLEIKTVTAEHYLFTAASPIALNRTWWLEFLDVRLPVVSRSSRPNG